MDSVPTVTTSLVSKDSLQRAAHKLLARRVPSESDTIHPCSRLYPPDCNWQPAEREAVGGGTCETAAGLRTQRPSSKLEVRAVRRAPGRFPSCPLAAAQALMQGCAHLEGADGSAGVVGCCWPAGSERSIRREPSERRERNKCLSPRMTLMTRVTPTTVKEDRTSFNNFLVVGLASFGVLLVVTFPRGDCSPLVFFSRLACGQG